MIPTITVAILVFVGALIFLKGKPTKKFPNETETTIKI